MILESLLAVGAAVLLDAALGDPPNRYHPTAWTGRLIARLVPAAAGRGPALERLGGAAVVAAALAAVIAAASAAAAGFSLLPGLYASLAAVLGGGLLLKTTLSVRGMGEHAHAVLDALEAGDLAGARGRLAMIVKRDTSDLDGGQVLSGVLESVGESTVDGVTGPLFYYGLFGLPGAFAYRAVNTADSMTGYRSAMFRDVGWFAARCDTVLNYVPARLTGIMMVAAAALLRGDWRGSYRTMARDARNPSSPNAGYPMAAMAGALCARLEKPGHYRLGEGAPPEPGHVRSAISLMRTASLLFAGAVTVPLAAVLSLLGWWAHA